MNERSENSGYQEETFQNVGAIRLFRLWHEVVSHVAERELSHTEIELVDHENYGSISGGVMFSRLVESPNVQLLATKPGRTGVLDFNSQTRVAKVRKMHNQRP